MYNIFSSVNRLMSEDKKLITTESFNAYSTRVEKMRELGFSKEGTDLYIEKMVAISEQVKNLHVKASINQREVHNDEPKDMGGTSNAPRPTETFLASLANCLEIGALLYFSFAKMRVESVIVKVEGTIDKRSALLTEDAPPSGFYDLTWTWYVRTDEDEKKVEKVLEKVEKSCPVKGTITRPQKFLKKLVMLNPRES